MNTIYAMPVACSDSPKGYGRVNPNKFAERAFLPDDEFFNDAIVVKVTKRKPYAMEGVKVSYRVVAGGFNSKVGEQIFWTTDTGLGHRRAAWTESFEIVAVIRNNKVIAGSAPSKSIPLYVFK